MFLMFPFLYDLNKIYLFNWNLKVHGQLILTLDRGRPAVSPSSHAASSSIISLQAWQ